MPLVRRYRARGEAAPLAAVLDYWRKPARSARWAETDLRSEEALVRLAWDSGLWACPVSASLDRLKDLLRNGVPVLVRVQEDALRADTACYALVCGFSDPAEGLLMDTGRAMRFARPYADFLRAWRVTDHRLLVVCPPDYPRWTLTGEERAYRARFYEFAGLPEKAVLDYEAALAVGWAPVPLLVSLGNVYRLLDRVEEAETLYRRALNEDPHQARAYNNLAFLLAEQNRQLDEAVTLARQALVLDPANPAVLDTLGFALFQQGRYQEASDVLERAWGRSRWHPVRIQIEIGLHLARAHLRNGQTHLAREVLRDVLSLDPHIPLCEELKPLAPQS